MEDNIKLAWQLAISQRTDFQLKTIHGLRHWKHVEEAGLSMAAKDNRINQTVVRLFACFHDCKRLSDGFDRQHGPRAAAFLEEVKDSHLGWLSDEEFRQLHEAVLIHTSQQIPTGDLTIDTCIDADRLDLGRIGIAPDPDKLLTPLGKEKAINKEYELSIKFRI